MLAVGLTAAEQALYHADLASTHEVRMVITITNTIQNPVSSNIAHMLIDGQIDGEIVTLDRMSQPFKDFDDPCILHTLSMTLLDPGYTLGFESGSPADGALYLDRMVSVLRSDYCPSLGRWVDCEMFVGPVTELTRDDDLVTVTAQGKEASAGGQSSSVLTFGAGLITDIVKSLLIKTGEVASRIGFPSLSDRTAKKISLLRDSRPWSKAYHLADGMGQLLFYNARGNARMSSSNVPVFRFDGTNICQFPSRTNGTQDLRNRVRVIVGSGSGEKPKFDVMVELPASHPNSAKNLGRNGVPKYLTETIFDDKIQTEAAARKRADKELRNRQVTAAGTRFMAFCVPGLELGDFVDVVLEGKAAKERVTSFAKPLKGTELMSVGQSKLISNPRRAAA